MRRFILPLLTLIIIIGCGEKKEFKYWERIDLGDKLKDSDVLSVAVDGKKILLGTYGNGAIISKNGGRKWQAIEHLPENCSGMPVISCGIIDNYILLGFSGRGILYSKDKGKSWSNFSDDILGGSFLYPTKIKIYKKKVFIASTDGLIMMAKMPDKITSADNENMTIYANESGLKSYYLYDVDTDGKSILIGALEGAEASTDGGKAWQHYSPGIALVRKAQSSYKVLAVAIANRHWYVGTGNGLFISADKGESWDDISRGLPSSYIYDILVDDNNNLWVATGRGLALSDNNGKSYRNFGRTSGFFGDNINCLEEISNGKILAGSCYGIYRMVDQIPFMGGYPKPYQDYSITETASHQWLSRPLKASDNNYLDQTRLYGTSPVNKGCYFISPPAAEALAVNDGTIVYISARDGHLVLKCSNRWNGYYVYAHYFNLADFDCYIGQKVSRRDVLGRLSNEIQTKGSYLYFEVSLSQADDSDVPGTPYNPELWFRPLPGCGTISGKLIDPEGEFINIARIMGAEKLSPPETPYSYTLSYVPDMSSDPAYRENFVISDLPEGDYILWAGLDDNTDAIKVRVAADKITRVTIASGGRTVIDSTAAPKAE